MATLSNSFDGGTDTTVITTGNSGGGSGDALPYITGSPTYSVTHAHSGGLSAKLAASATRVVGYQMSAADVYIRSYFWLQSHIDDGLLRLWSGTAGGGGFLGGVDTAVNGSLDLRIGVATTVNLAGPIALNQWIRVEGHWSTTAGGELRLYNAADGPLTGSVTTATNMTGTSNTQNAIRAAATDSWVDDFAVSTDGWIGPTASAYPRSPVISPAAVHRASRW